jgi:predicted peroxiredoxin
MVQKRVAIIIKCPPNKKEIVKEGLRMAVGLTLRDNEINIFFINKGGKGAAKISLKELGDSDIKRHINTLIELGQTIAIEDETIESPCEFDYTGSFIKLKQEVIFSYMTLCNVTIVVQ